MPSTGGNTPPELGMVASMPNGAPSTAHWWMCSSGSRENFCHAFHMGAFNGDSKANFPFNLIAAGASTLSNSPKRKVQSLATLSSRRHLSVP